MFGRKKKEQEIDSLSLGKDYVEDPRDELPQQVQQVPQAPQMPQQVPNYQQIQPMPQPTPQYYPPQNQPQSQQYYPPRQMPKREALVVKTEMRDNGEFVSVIISNYQLNIGDCQVNQ